MKSSFLSLLLLFFIKSMAFSQEVDWLKYYDSQMRGELIYEAKIYQNDIFLISDIEVYPNSRISEEIILNIRRVDKDGNLLWTKEINPDSLNRFKAYKITDVDFFEDKILVRGYCNNNTGLNSYFIVIVNTSGSLLFRNVFYFNKQHHLLDVNYSNPQVVQVLFNKVDDTSKFYQYNLSAINPYIVLSVDSVNYLQPINVRYVDSLIYIFNVDKDTLSNLRLRVTKFNNNLSFNSEVISNTNVKLHSNFSSFFILNIDELNDLSGWILRGQFRGVFDNPNIAGFEMDNYIIVTNKEGETREQYYFNKNNQNSYSISTDSYKCLSRDSKLIVTHKIKIAATNNDYRYRIQLLNSSNVIWEKELLDPSASSLLSSFPVANLSVGTSVMSVNQLPNSRVLISQFNEEGNIYREWVDSIDNNDDGGNVYDAIFADNNLYLIGLNVLTNRTDADVFIKKIGIEILGVSQNLKSNIKVVPNPFNNYIQIYHNDDKFDVIEIYDTLGKLIKTEKCNTKVDMSGLLPGQYYLTFKSKNKRYTTKLIKH